uniref:Uncharacterized protein n=1 Tax=Setaria italica TaxID=4555 RepID=K4AIQ1_SETIT
MIRSHIPMPALRQLLRPVELSSSSGGGGPRAVSQVPVQIFLATLYPFLAAREANKYLRPDIFPAPPRVGPPRGKAPARNCGSFLHQFVFLLIFCVSASSLQFLKGKKFLFIEEQETQHWFHRIE